MKAHIAFIVTFVLCFSAGLANAQDSLDIPFIPKPHFEACQPEYRCLDDESYKLVLDMRAQYVFLHEAYTVNLPYMLEELKKEAEALEAAADTERDRAEQNLAAYNELEKRYLQLLDKRLEPGWLDRIVDAWPLIAAGTLIGALGTLIVITVHDSE